MSWMHLGHQFETLVLTLFLMSGGLLGLFILSRFWKPPKSNHTYLIIDQSGRRAVVTIDPALSLPERAEHVRKALEACDAGSRRR